MDVVPRASAAEGAAAFGAEEDDEDFGASVGSHGEEYIVMERLGGGSYGQVYKAIHRDTQALYAIKKIRIHYEEEGVPSTAIREVSLLKECDHPNVIKLHDVFSKPTALYLVFEYVEMDLKSYFRRHGAFSDPEALEFATYQCFRGVEFCHGHRILHRDLKPQNILIDVATRFLKLADFGLARAFSVPLQAYTHEVVTLWYRAPEILLGVAKYATPTDIWSLGCVMAEMATAMALFPGDSEIDTIFKIFRRLGTPTDEVWPGVSTLRDFKKEFPKWRNTDLAEVREKARGLSEAGLDLILACLRYNPAERPSARAALREHHFFDPIHDTRRARPS